MMQCHGGSNNLNDDVSSYTAAKATQGVYYDCVAIACLEGFLKSGPGWGKYYCVTFNCVALACNAGFMESSSIQSIAHYNSKGIFTATLPNIVGSMVGLELAKLIPPFIKITRLICESLDGQIISIIILLLCKFKRWNAYTLYTSREKERV